MAIIAQVSVRLPISPVSQEEFYEIGRQAERLAVEAAQRIYGERPIEIDVYLEEGSVWVRLTVAGGLLLGVYHGVAKYKDFKESVVELKHDATSFGNAIAENLKALAGPKKNEVRVTKRTMTPGRLSLTIDRLEKLNESRGAMSERSFEQQLGKIAQELKAIEKDLTPVEIAKLESSLRFENLPTIGEIKSDRRYEVTIPRVAVRRRSDGVASRGQSTEMKDGPARKKFKYHNLIKLNLRDAESGHDRIPQSGARKILGS